MKKVVSILFLSVLTHSVNAVTMEVVSCWKGFSQKEQNQNLSACQKTVQDLQICATNLFEHKQAAFDVCLMEASEAPTTIKAHFLGHTHNDQVKNLSRCQALRKPGQLCITNWLTHGQAVYDVALME